MKKILYLFLMLFMVSCIGEEPLNPEADIDEFAIDPQLLTSKTVIDQANRKILIYLKPEAYQNGFHPL